MKKYTTFYKILFFIICMTGHQALAVGPGKVYVDHNALGKVQRMINDLESSFSRDAFLSGSALGGYLKFLNINDYHSRWGVLRLLRAFYETKLMSGKWTHHEGSDTILRAEFGFRRNILDHLRDRAFYTTEPRIKGPIEPQSPAETIVLFLEAQIAFIESFRDTINERILKDEFNIEELINEIFDAIYQDFKNCVGFNIIPDTFLTEEVRSFIRLILMDITLATMRENPNTVLRAINTFAIENITWEAWQQLTNEDLQPMMQQVHAGMINRPGLRGFINEFLENHYGNTPMTNEVIDAAVGTIQEALTAQGRTTTPDTIRLHVMAWINNRGLDMEVVNNEQTEVMTPSVITHPNINHCGSRSVVIVAAGLLASALSAYYFGSF